MENDNNRDMIDPDDKKRKDPCVWAVTGYRAGEQTQILALAKAMGWPFEIKHLAYRNTDWLPGLLRLESLMGIDLRNSSKLSAPWPDLVISAGMRNEPVCRWIRRQSGNRTRLVHLGRPWVPIEQIDLVVTTPQYRLPEHDNVLHNLGTMNLVSEETLAVAAQQWAEPMAALSRPLTGIVLGGNSGPYTFGPAAAREMATLVSAMVSGESGSLAITSSARTSAAALDTFLETIDCPYYLYRWTPDSSEENPYLGILALSDRIIVTSDSVSMISEAVATKKPIYVYKLADCGGDATETNAAGRDFRLSATLYGLLMRYGHQRLTRDLGLFHQRLIESGRSSWLGGESKAIANPGLSDMERTVQRVRELMDSKPPGAGDMHNLER
jgi:mitochondrial fission protein ELM1